jgi:hypothetical protein
LNRLVGDDQPRPKQERARHHDTPTLTARELMREAAEKLLRLQTDGSYCFADQPPRLSAGGGEAEAP